MSNGRVITIARLLRIVIALGITGSIIVSLWIQYRIRVSNAWQQYARFPQAPVPHKNDVVVVVAPHCDDETLGCGGLLATAKRNGARVRVVIVTNGDGYRIGLVRRYGKIRVTPAMCIKYAYDRQKETLKALKILGIDAGDVTFLGYPDRGISALWNEYWSGDTLYMSHTTNTNRSPYRNSFTQNVPYCGESLMGDLQKILAQEKPTLLYAPHPFDDHPDHYTTYCFVAAAVRQLQLEQASLASRIKLFTYLVHRGDWPVPRGDYANELLAPPSALSRGDTKWLSLPLDSEITKVKRAAIKCYKSQTVIEKGFLMSFARRNEIFGELQTRTLPTVIDNQIAIDGFPNDWKNIKPALIDPTGDHLLREISKGSDVRAIYLCQDTHNLYVRMDCERPLSKWVIYNLDLRTLPEDKTTIRSKSRSQDNRSECKGLGNRHQYSVIFKPPNSCQPSTTTWAVHRNVLELALPKDILGQSNTLFVQVRTKLARITTDKTGWVELRMDSTTQTKTSTTSKN
ncbi:MAG: PIG-L deacetylase family protein [Armatimonadota bacterium]